MFTLIGRRPVEVQCPHITPEVLTLKTSDYQVGQFIVEPVPPDEYVRIKDIGKRYDRPMPVIPMLLKNILLKDTVDAEPAFGRRYDWTV